MNIKTMVNRMNESRLIAGCRACLLAMITVVLFFGGCGEKVLSPDQMLAQAKQERDKGGHSAAVIHLKNLLQQSPDHPEARFLLGETYLDTGNLGLAEADLRKALDLGYDTTKVVPAFGKALLMQGKFQNVLDKVSLEGESDNTAQARILTLRGLAMFGLNRRAEGRQLLEQALAKQPDLSDALLALARLEAGEKKIAASTRLIERAIASTPKNAEAWMLKGDVSRLNADQAGAMAAYEKVVEINPRNIPAHLAIASLQIEAGKFDEAGKHIGEVRKLVPENPMALYMQALIEVRKRDFAAAREQILKVLKVAPKHTPSVLLAGAVESELGSHNLAQTYFGQALGQEPGNLYARKLMIASLAKTGRLQRALEVLQPGLKQAPEDPALLGLAGDLHLRNNEFAKAAQYFESAAKLDPKSAGARTGLAMSRLGIGETERAYADLEAAVQLDAGNYQADVVLVMSHLQRSNYDQALKAIASLEKKQPGNPLTYNLKASIYAARKDTAMARKLLERALELQPTYVPAAVNLAQIDLQEKNPKLARQRFEKILEKDRNNVQALLALANLAPRIGATPKEAIGWYERAVESSAGALQPQLLLARAYAREGEFKKALTLAETAQQANPDSAEVLDTLGKIQVAAGEKDKALATFRRLVTLQPASPLALFDLAGAQALRGDTAAATGTLKKALSLKPDFVDAQRALVELEIRAGRHSEALKIAQQVQKQAAKLPLGYALEGDVRMAEKNYAQAMKSYETAFGMGKSGVLLVKLHTASVMGGKRTEADARLAQWLEASPEDVGVRLYVADVGLRDKDYKRAIEQYEIVLRKQPENVLVLNNLSWAYQQVKDPRALATVERAYKLKPDSPEITDTLGWMLSEQGNTSRGVELLQKAVAAAPGAQLIRLHLAQTYLKMGDKAKARAELERIESTGTEFPEKADAMNLLKQLK